MTRRRNLERHRHNLVEIRGIMNSMKTLAYMETRKLDRFLDAQHAVVRGIEAAAADLLGFHPHALPDSPATTTVYLVAGTERGFCGDFNHVLLKSLESALAAQSEDDPLLIAVGHKLHTLLEGDARVAAMLDGASVAEEITALINRVANALAAIQARRGALNVYCLYNGGDEGILARQLLPPFQDVAPDPPRYSHPPMLNLSPQESLAGLTEHYLFAALHEMFYTSLMVENQHRVAHLEGAVRHLDDKSVELTRRCNALRQEEIIEEIEVILLSATSLGEQPDRCDDAVRHRRYTR